MKRSVCGRPSMALFLGVAVVLAGGCGRKAPGKMEKVTIAVSTWPASAQFYVAREKGYFKDEGLDAELRPVTSGHIGLHAVLAGKVDLAPATDTPIARAAVDGKRVAIVATLCEIDKGILIIARKDRGISAPGDLRGKRIGLARGSAAEFYLHTYLTTSYTKPDSVRIVDIAADKVGDALLGGRVDAVSTWAPYTTQLLDELGNQAVVLHEPAIYTMTWNLAARPELTRSDPELIEKLLRALVRANAFITEHPDDARAIAANCIGASGTLSKQEWADFHFFVELDQSLIVSLEGQARWMLGNEAGSTHEIPNFLDFIFVDALKAVQPEAITIPGKQD